MLTSLSHAALAHDVYQGTLKGSNLPCTLEIDQVYYENNIETPENLRADIVVSLEDSHHKMAGHGEEFSITVKLSSDPLIYTGVGSNQKDQVNLVTTDGTFKTLSLYAVKWMHFTHFHSAQCLNLKYVNH